MCTYEEAENRSSWLKSTVLALYRMGYPKDKIAWALCLNDPRIERWVEEYEQEKTQKQNG